MQKLINPFDIASKMTQVSDVSTLSFFKTGANISAK